MEIQTLLAQNIKAAIDRQGLKQKYVAERAGFTDNSFSAMLTGRKLIRAEYIPIIADALGVTPNDLYSADRPA